MQVIKTGLLSIPTYDEAAIAAVRALLRRTVPAALILADRHIEGQRYLVEELLRRWCDEEELDLVVTIGGTLPAPGPGPREIVPEATAAVVERPMPGLVEAMRACAAEETMLALLDRSTAGIRGRTLIVNLPAGAEAAVLFLESIGELLEPVLAHLQERPDAPQIADALAIEPAGGDSEAVQPPAPAPLSDPASVSRSSRSLDAGEFADYLRRRAADS